MVWKVGKLQRVFIQAHEGAQILCFWRIVIQFLRFLLFNHLIKKNNVFFQCKGEQISMNVDKNIE